MHRGVIKMSQQQRFRSPRKTEAHIFKFKLLELFPRCRTEGMLLSHMLVNARLLKFFFV